VRSASEERPDLFSSVAFWYQEGIARDQPPVPYGAARLPHGNARQIEVETLVGDVKTEGGKASVQKEVFWSKDLLFFAGRGPGASLDLPLDVAEDGDYELVAQVAHSPDYGDYNVLVDGRSPAATTELEHEPGATGAAAPVIQAYFPETYVAEDHLIGWLKLSKGRHRVAFVCTGKRAESTGYFLGIDTLILARIGASATPTASVVRASSLRRIGERGPAGAVRLTSLVDGLKDTDGEVREAAAWALGQLSTAAAPAEPALRGALADGDAVVRGLAALALGDMGKAARPSLDALIARLQDDDVNVRMVTAQAIGQQGASAASAVEALIAAARRPGEHVHAQRAVATALGRIGPAAAPAIPVLEQLARIPRVQ
jgi:hypothetical protein